LSMTVRRVVDRRSWRAGTRAARLRPALAPLAWLYGAASAGVRAARAAPPPPDGCTVISVGNLEAGGSGKTPLAIELLDRVRIAGRRAAYCSRAWGGRAARFPGVTLVAPSGEAPPSPPGGTRVLLRDTIDAARELGDEAAVVSRRSPGAGLSLGARKARAVEAASGVLGADVVVADDALQSWGMSRHLDVVLLDGTSPLGDGLLLPAGRLREEPAALARADVVVFNGQADADVIAALTRDVAPWCAEHAVFGGLRRTVSVEAPRDARVACLCGIARPEAFEASVAASGANVVLAVRHDDHHRYRPADLAESLREADAAGADFIVTTEKDWVKLESLAAETERFRVARLDVALVGEAAARIDAVVRGGGKE